MTKLKQSFGVWSSRLLTQHLPRRTKRLIFLTSLLAVMKNTTELSLEVLAKLNAMLILAKDEHALQLPARLSTRIWNGSSLKEISESGFGDLSEVPSDAVAEVTTGIIKNIPCWLHYAREADIRSDITTILTNRNEFTAA